MRRAEAAAGTRAKGSARAGYSLPEILIVLVILGLAVGVVTPAFFGMFERAQLRRHAAAIETAVRQAPFEARRARAPLILDAAYFARRHAFPRDWAIAVEPPIRVRANGVCEGGRIVIRREGGPPRIIDVAAPRCMIADDAA